MRGTWCACLVLLLSFSVQADPNADLDKASALLDELNYKQAAPALDAAWKRPNNDRTQVLKILELQGVVAATLNQAPKATAYFQQLLALDPGHTLAGDLPPRVMTPFYEARGRTTDKALDFHAVKAAASNGRVIQVAADVNDPTRLAKKVRFHLRNDGGGWAVSTQDAASKHAAASADGKRVEWWAELLNEYDGVLASLGDEGKPQLEGEATQPVAEVMPPPPPPPNETVAASTSAPWPAGRWAGIAIGAAGVIAIGVGVAEGLQASSLRDQVNGAKQDANHNVNGITQAKAFQLDAQQRTAATVANACLIGGAVLAAGGVTLVVFSGPGDTQVSLVPAGAGVGLSGSF